MYSTFGGGKLSHYEVIEMLGSQGSRVGAYGEVFKGKNKQTHKIVAIKKILRQMDEQGFAASSIREISLLKELNQDNIIKLQDIIVNDGWLYLVLEWAGTDLKKFIEGLGTGVQMQPWRVKKLLHQLLSGVSQCHSKRILHRDLKPANLLIDDKGNLKIGDFGLARTFSYPIRPYTHEVVTLWYRAPEIMLGATEYSTAIDIWAVGCIFAEMVTKRILFEGDSEIDQLYRIFRVLGTPSQKTWKGVSQLKDFKSTFPSWQPGPLEVSIPGLNLDAAGLDLLGMMLKLDPCQRITAKQALSHSYFDGFKSL